MIILKPASRRWFLGGIATVIAAASSFIPGSASALAGERWEGTAGDFAWRTRPDQMVPAGKSFWWNKDAIAGKFTCGHRDLGMAPALELKHRSEIDPAEWDRLNGLASEYPTERRATKPRYRFSREEAERRQAEAKRPIPVAENDAPRDTAPRQFKLSRQFATR